LPHRPVDQDRHELRHSSLQIAGIRLADQRAHLEVVHLTGEVVNQSFGDVRYLLFNGQRNSGHDPSTLLTTTEVSPLSHSVQQGWQAEKL